MVRRAEWWIAALLLSLARLNDVAAQSDAAAHRELLQFNLASPGETNGVVTGVADLINGVVGRLADGIRVNTPATTAPSTTAGSPTPQIYSVETPSPATAAPLTAAPTTAAPAIDAPLTDAPLTEAVVTNASTPKPTTADPATAAPTPVVSASDLSPAAETEAPVEAATEDAVTYAGSQAAATLFTDSTETEAGITEAMTPTADSGSDNAEEEMMVIPSGSRDASSASGGPKTKSARQPQSDVVSNSNLSGNGTPKPSLEENVTPAVSSAAPAAAPSTTAPRTTAPVAAVTPPVASLTAPPVAAAGGVPSATAAAIAVPSVIPSTAPITAPSAAPATSSPGNIATVQPPAATAAPEKNSKPTLQPSDAGQVHAPSYNGSMESAVRGVGKNATDPVSHAPKKSKKSDKSTSAGSSSQAQMEAVGSSNTSSGGRYSLGTSSILSIIGVVVGICAIIALFVFISRKKYGEESSDDELPMAYGYRIDGGSIVRMSPTFLHNGENSVDGHRPPNNFDQDNTSSSGDSGEEKVAYFDNSFAVHQTAQSQAPGGNIVGASSKPSQQLSSIYSASENSESWSSVMESEFDTVSRCTRDTNLSAVTTTPHTSESNRGTGSTRRARNKSGSTFSGQMSDTSSNYRSTRASSHKAFEGYDSYSTVPLAASQATSAASGGSANAARSTSSRMSFYRSSSIARSTALSDFGSDTRSSSGSSIYSVDSKSPFDV